MRRLLGIGLAALLLSGCAGFKNPDASLADIKFDEVGWQQTKLRLFLKIKNRNDYDLVLSPLQTLVWVGEDRPVIEIDRQDYKLLKESETIIVVPIVLNYKRILSAIPTAVKTLKLRYQFKGTAHVGVLSRDFDLLGSYPPPKSETPVCAFPAAPGTAACPLAPAREAASQPETKNEPPVPSPSPSPAP